ncbi:MAG: ComEA family DNA-binding protein [Thermoguttaceae bacterium]
MLRFREQRKLVFLLFLASVLLSLRLFLYQPIDKLKGATSGIKSETILLVDPNLASSVELLLLPGIGPVLTERILESRTQEGRFVEVDDLRRVKGIGPKKLEKITPFLQIDKDSLKTNP